MKFRDYISSEDRYNKFLTSIMKSRRYPEYRLIKHDDLLRYYDSMTEFALPRLVKIPKDNGKFRDVFVYGTIDNLILKLLNEYLNIYYPEKVNEKVYSYKKNVSVFKAVRDFYYSEYDAKKTYIKLDLENYFMSVPSIEGIKLLRSVGIEEQAFETLFRNQCISNGEVIEMPMGVLPGAPISAFLSNAYLKSFDDCMCGMFSSYIRYSDDMLLKSSGDIDKDLQVIAQELKKVGVAINYNKVDVFMPQDTIKFLGFEIDKDGTDIGLSKFVAVKKEIRRFAKRVVKYNKPEEEKVSIFFEKVYKYFLYPVTLDMQNIGLIGFWFSGATKIDRLQELDYYILDRARYVVSGKNNKGALAAGYNTQALEELGFESLAKMFKQVKHDPFMFASKAYSIVIRRKKFFAEHMYACSAGAVEEIDLITAVLSRKRIDGLGYIEDILVDFDEDRLILNNHVIWGRDARDVVWKLDGIPAQLDTSLNQVTLNSKQLLALVFNASKKCEVGTKRKINNHRFVRVPRRLMPYYAFSGNVKKDNLILNIVLWMHKQGLLHIDFTERDEPYYLERNEHIYFVIDKEMLR